MPRLRIAVVGVGGIGSTFASWLARNGRHDVTVVARPGSPRLQQLQRDQGIIDADGRRTEVRVADTLDEQIPYDLVLVTVLAHQVDAVLPTLQRSVARCIQFMFNTFDPARLEQAVGADRCAFGMPFVQAHLDRDGRLHATVGATGQKNRMSEPRWVDVFVAAGLPAVHDPEMQRWLRCHVPLCIAFESVSVAGVRRGGGASWSEALVLARGIHQGFALIDSMGLRLYPSGKAWLDRSPVWIVAAMLWSMSRIRSFRELLATGSNECRALVDVMVAMAPRGTSRDTLAAIEAMKPDEQPR